MKVGEWPRVTLSSVSVVFTDGDWIESKDQSPTGIRLIQTGNVGVGEFKDRAEKARYVSEDTFRRLRCEEIYEGDCLVSRLPDPVGRACIIPTVEERLITAVDCTIIRFNTRKIHPNYFRYFSQSAAYLADIESACTGATRKRISRNKLGEIRLPLPPLPEQRRIVAILDETFEAIDTAITNAETNLTNARDLFERCISSAFDRQSDTRSLTVRELAAQDRGSIRTGPFGSQLLHGEFVDAGIAVLGIDNVVENRFTWNRRRYITAEKYASLRRYTVKPGDVLISIMGTCGRCAIVPNDIELAINSKHLCCISLDRTKCLPEYLHAYFQFHPHARAYLSSQSKGSIMDGLNMGIIQEMPVLVPSLVQQKTIAELFERARFASNRLADIQTGKIALLRDLRQAILGKAFAGELTAQPEKALPEAAE